MKKLFYTVLLVSATIASTTANAATVTKRLQCDNADYIIEPLMAKFGESLLFVGDGTDDDQGTKIALLVNKETGTWTILQMRKDIACFLANGDNALLSK